VFCRLRPAIKIQSSLKYDDTMFDDGEIKYSFDSIFGKYATQD